MSWTYKAKQNTDCAGHIPVLVEKNGDTHILPNYGYHSPDGFQIGYGGSGPADLAFSILMDYYIEKNNGVVIELFELKQKVERLHQQFKNDFIVVSKNVLNISSKEIELWVKKNDKNI